jgi:hypothetical protein
LTAVGLTFQQLINSSTWKCETFSKQVDCTGDKVSGHTQSVLFISMIINLSYYDVGPLYSREDCFSYSASA